MKLRRVTIWMVSGSILTTSCATILPLYHPSIFSRHFAGSNTEVGANQYRIEVCAFEEKSVDTLGDAILVHAAEIANQAGRKQFSIIERKSHNPVELSFVSAEAFTGCWTDKNGNAARPFPYYQLAQNMTKSVELEGCHANGTIVQAYMSLSHKGTDSERITAFETAEVLGELSGRSQTIQNEYCDTSPRPSIYANKTVNKHAVSND